MTGIDLQLVRFLDLGQDLPTVRAGHVEVQQDDAGSGRLRGVGVLAALEQVVEGLVAVRAAVNRVGHSGLLEGANRGLAVLGAVLDEQHASVAGVMVHSAPERVK